MLEDSSIECAVKVTSTQAQRRKQRHQGHSMEDVAGLKITSGICLEILDLGEGGSLWGTVTAAQHWLNITWLAAVGSLVQGGRGREAFWYLRDLLAQRQVKVHRRRDLHSQLEEERGFHTPTEQGSIYRTP